MTEFNFLPMDRVVYGKKSINTLNGHIERLGKRKALIVTGSSVSKGKFFSSICNIIGIDYVVFSDVTQHSPIEEIEHAIESFRNNGCDIIISVGGGSVIDSSKMIRHYYDVKVPQIAIPTTLSASEFSHIAGYTIDSEKNGVRDKAITPTMVIIDPDAAKETPDRLWRSTGIRSLDHAIETIFSNGESEIARIMALGAIEKLFKNLMGKSDENRLECFMAAWYSYFEVYDSKMGLSHNIGKVIGSKWEIPHGITSCMTLPLAMKYYGKYKVKETSEIKHVLAGTPYGNTEPWIAVSKFIENLGLASKPLDYSLTKNDIPYIMEKLKDKPDWAEEMLTELLSMENQVP